MPFNSDNYGNVVNPCKLSKKKVQEIVEEVDDPRLENSDGDYFILRLDDRETHIPKQEKISVESESGHISPVKTADYIKQLLDEADSQQ